MSIQGTPVLLRWFIQILNNTNTKIQILNVQLHKKGFFSHSGLKAHWCFSLLLFLYCFLDILKLDLLIFSHRVAKCHRYGRLICVNFLEVWGKISECNIRASCVCEKIHLRRIIIIVIIIIEAVGQMETVGEWAGVMALADCQWSLHC